MIEIIKLLVAPAIGLIGVLVGSRLKFKSDIKVKKEFLAREIRINKLQEISHELSEMMREVAYSVSNITKRLHNEIADGEFRNLNDEHQERLIRWKRSLNIKMVFINKDYQKRIGKFYDMSDVIDDKIFEGFHNPNTNNRRFSNDEITFDAIKKDIIQATEYVYQIIKDLNEDLLKEIEELK
ncbi:hypothetical protein [Niallia circulans]|uniref:Uncharacterized protein n=1 Tax=Niallia circulans TaxID=1397 RepID=A0A941G8M8_NIACI|nr:hypothetical protein [Niallia circulans]MCB5235497.1 hypothetical protein [Niallia circulans]